MNQENSKPRLQDMLKRVDEIHDVLEGRSLTHGEFESNAHVSQIIKKGIESGWGAKKLSHVHVEALHAIAAKMARIASGNPDDEDHWRDISGYATLVLKHINKNKMEK